MSKELEEMQSALNWIDYYIWDYKETKDFEKQANVKIEILQKGLDTIKKYLEVLEILKKKEVAIDELKNCIKKDSENMPALEEYNAFAGDENSLTQEEFDLLQEWLER